MAWNLPQPIDPSQAYQDNLRQRLAILAQPTPIQTLAPQIGQTISGLVNARVEGNKNRSVLQAKQDFSDFLAKHMAGTATPEDYAKGMSAGASMGVHPELLASMAGFSKTPQKTPDQISAEAEAKQAGTNKANIKYPKPVKPGQDLTTEEMKALTTAARRSNNPLPVSLVSFRGPRAKIIAQSLIADPNWSPNPGEGGLAGARAGSAASERLTQGGSSQVVARTANSAYEQMDILKKVSDQFPRANVQIANKPIISLLKQGSPEAQNWLTAVNSVRYEYATALARGNKPGEQDITDAKVALPDTITPVQLDHAIPLMKQLLKATVKGQMTPAGLGNDSTPTGTQGKTPEQRYNELKSSGMAEDQIYKTLAAEGH